MHEKRKYDSTVARIAGNILSGVLRQPWPEDGVVGWHHNDVKDAVALARAIVAEVERTEHPPVSQEGAAHDDGKGRR